MADISIQHVTFRPDDIVEITYTEPHDVTDTVAVVKTIIVENKLLDQDELTETMQNLQGMVDAGLLQLRNPTQTA